MKSLEIKVPTTPESIMVVVLTVFRQVLEIRVIGTCSSFHSPIACTSLIVTSGDTDIVPVFHIKNPLQGGGSLPHLLPLLQSSPALQGPSSSQGSDWPGGCAYDTRSTGLWSCILHMCLHQDGLRPLCCRPSSAV